MRYTLEEIAALTGGRVACGSDGSREFCTVNSDSRQITDRKTLFAALKGDHFDGHIFVKELCADGGALIDDEKYACPNSIFVPSVKEALYKLALHERAEKLGELAVLAVTGSVGKTTVKNMAGLVMASHFSTYKSVGNRNSLTGLPMEVLNIPAGCTHAVLEAGMSDPGEIAAISKLVRPSAAIITNIGHSHILAFGSREAICEEKLSILCGMQTPTITVPDEPLLTERLKNTGGAVFCSVTDKSAEAYAEDICQTASGMRYTACFNGRKTTVNLPVTGVHNVMNSLLCFVAGVRFGVPEEKAAYALNGFKTEGNRQAIWVTNGVRVIADCYNASPESMAAALGVLKTGSGRRIAVLGDMLELGEHSKRLHAQVGEAVFGSADLLICLGSDAQYIAESALSSGMDDECVYCFGGDEYENAAKLLSTTVCAGDTVLFKASNRTNIKKVMEITAL